MQIQGKSPSLIFYAFPSVLVQLEDTLHNELNHKMID